MGRHGWNMDGARIRTRSRRNLDRIRIPSVFPPWRQSSPFPDLPDRCHLRINPSKTPSGSFCLIMTPLPIDPRIPEIVNLLRQHRRLVLVAPPGAGKTTRVPVAMVKAGLLPQEHPALVLLQPR